MRTWRENNLLREETNTNEEKVVGYREYKKEIRALNYKYNNTIGGITISNISSDLNDEPIELGINWASIGSVSVDEALEFVSEIRQAVKECENFKYNGYYIDWSKD